MMRRLRAYILVLLALFALGRIPVALGLGAVAAHGTAHQVLVENDEASLHDDCEGDGHASLTWASNPNRLFVTMEAVGCLPTWSLISACGQLLADGTFRCERRGPTEHLNVTLTPTGGFEFYWSTPDFLEWDVGTLVRTP